MVVVDLVFVDGEACMYDAKSQQTKDLLVKAARLPPHRVHVMCTAARARCVCCAAKPGDDGGFVRTVLDAVQGLLAAGHVVVLLGWSYGGSVVASISEILQSPNLHMATYDSTRIPSPSPNIVHYMRGGSTNRFCDLPAPPPHVPQWDAARRVLWLSAHSTLHDVIHTSLKHVRGLGGGSGGKQLAYGSRGRMGPSRRPT